MLLPQHSFRTSLQFLVFSALALFVCAHPATARACDPQIFDGTYELRCAGQPTLTLRGEIAGPRGKESGNRRLPLSCDRVNDPEFRRGVDEFTAWAGTACRKVSPNTDCPRAAEDLKASLLAIHDGLIAAIPSRLQVIVGPRNLFGHEMRATETTPNGVSRPVTYTLAACKPARGQRGDFLALGLPVFQPEGDRRGGCLAVLGAASSGNIDPGTFAITKSFTVDGSLTCRVGDRQDWLSLHLGAKFEGSSTGRRP